jgi:hypothetical protein
VTNPFCFILILLARSSFQGVPRGSVNLGPAKYQSHPQQQQLQQVNEYHAGPFASATYSHLKSSADSRAVIGNASKFDYADYSPHPSQQQQQSYAAPYGYPSYAQNYGSTSTGDYQQQQQQYHGGYAQVGETNPLGMLVSSATNPQAPPDAMPHEPVNIGLKDSGDRKYRQTYPSDSFLSSSGGGYVHGIERPGNVVQLKSTASTSQQQPAMYQRSNMYASGATYYSHQQRTQEPTQQPNPLDLVPPSAAMGASFDANGNGASSSMARGGMFAAGPRMAQFSASGAGPSLTTRLKDGGVDISTGASSNGGHLPFMQQQQQQPKSLEVTHSTSLYSDVARSTTSMAMVSLSSDGPASVNANALYPPHSAPPPAQLSAGTDDTCSLCSGTHSDRIASHCGHRFHAQCLHTWGGTTTCPICTQVRSVACLVALPPYSRGVFFALCTCSPPTRSPAFLSRLQSAMAWEQKVSWLLRCLRARQSKESCP